MSNLIPTEIAAQLEKAKDLIVKSLPTVKAIHLYGSALDGGLKPSSDIDLLVTLVEPLSAEVRGKILSDLLKISAYPGTDKNLRALEVTFILESEVSPWRQPAKRELQFGEWLRADISAGIFEQPMVDYDLTVLLTKVRHHSVALLGPEAKDLFAPIPFKDFQNTMLETIQLWNTASDWKGDERNVILTLARIWYSAALGEIAPKDVAASWVLQRLPLEHQSVLYNAQQAYLGQAQEDLAGRDDEIKSYVDFVKSAVGLVLG